MEINRHNYEAYLLDQLEGTLSVDKQQELHNFLLLNPDCSAELTEIEPWTLEGEKVRFQNGRLLKKELPTASTLLEDHNFDLSSIARLEGDLSAEQIAAHQAMLEADDLKVQEWEEWQHTTLVPEPILFHGKDKLKRRLRPSIRVITMGVISAAAAVALLFILFNSAPDLSRPESNQQVSQEDGSSQVYDVPTQASNVPSQAEAQMAVVETLESQTVQTTAAPPAHKVKDPVMFSIKKDHDRPLEIESEAAVVPVDDLQPRVLAQAATQFSKPAASVEAPSDQIKPLHVPPVPIHIRSLSVAQISKLDLQDVIEDYTEEKDFSLLSIANAGIKGINKVAGSDISLLASRDEEGDVSGFQLKSKRFSFTRPLSRED